jgi:hypothetical protein
MACGSSPFVEDEPTEFSLDYFPLGDLGYFVPFMRCLEDIPNFFGAFQPLHLVVLLSTQGSEEYGGGFGVEVRIDDVSFYHSTYNNLHHQSMVVCLME